MCTSSTLAKGGVLRISLTDDAPQRSGKTSGRTDTYHGRFVKLVYMTGCQAALAPADNEVGWHEALVRLAAHLESAE